MIFYFNILILIFCPVQNQLWTSRAALDDMVRMGFEALHSTSPESSSTTLVTTILVSPVSFFVLTRCRSSSTTSLKFLNLVGGMMGVNGGAVVDNGGCGVENGRCVVTNDRGRAK